MKKSKACEFIRQIGIIPAIKVFSAEEAHFAAEWVMNGGIPIVEITMIVPDAVKLIAHLVTHHHRMLVGAGMVLDAETARQCMDAGACFLTSPNFDSPILEFTARDDVAILPGALTPSEVVAAWRAGADFVKIFPCSQVGGDKYIKALKAALPPIPFIAAGGVTQQSAASFILAGAVALGVGDELIPPEAIEQRESQRIRELSRRFLGFVKEARSRLPPQKQSAATAADFWDHHRHSPNK